MRTRLRTLKKKSRPYSGRNDLVLLGGVCLLLDGMKDQMAKDRAFGRVTRCSSWREARRVRPRPQAVFVSQGWVIKRSNGGLIRLRRELKSAKFILITSHCGPNGNCAGSHFGADACLPVTTSMEQLKRCFKSVLKGGSFVYCADVGCAAERCLSQLAIPDDLPERLSRREKEVLLHICGGLTNKETANALGLSVRTVEGHRAHLMEKTGARSAVGLINLFRKS